MLRYRNTPAGPRMLRPWMTCPAGSWPPLAVASRRSRPLGGDPDRRVSRFRDGYQSAALRTRSPARPGLPRVCLARPKSFIYHFAAEALLALV